MCHLVLLSVLGLCISQLPVAFAASSHHHGHQHAFMYHSAKQFPRIVEMPTHSWGHVSEAAKPLEDATVEGLHSSPHQGGFQRALVNAEKKVQEEEKQEKQAQHVGYQRALENAELHLENEHKVYEEEEKARASKNHMRSQHTSSNQGNHEKEKKRHVGFQRALENAEKHALEQQKNRKAEQARRAAEAKETEEEAREAAKARDEGAITIRTRDQQEHVRETERAREEDKAREEEALRQKELQEADAEGERLELENARRLISKRDSENGPWNPVDAIKKGFEEGTKASKKGFKGMKDALDDVYEKTGKPFMNPINTMRAELCIRRKPLLTHKPCMKFMVKECKTKSSGKGYCKKFFHMVLDACFRAQEQGEDPEGYCELAESMGNKRDVDEDGVPDITDRFPADRNEWSDMDNDGIGDNADPDRDGDGFLNENDPFPDDPERPGAEKGDIDGDGIPDDEDPDKDGDGYDNEVDAFPEDPTRWLGDGPYPAPAPAEPPPSAEIAEAPAPPAAAPGMTKEIVGLPEQGYGEYFRGNLVKYEDGDDFNGDWQGEWPLMDETHEESVLKACENHPKSGWCMRFKRKHGIK